MRSLSLDGPPLRLLAIGAHPDDIEIGCGGTILRLAEEGRIACAKWVVLSGEGERAKEARDGAAAFLDGIDTREIEVLDFRDGYFPQAGAALKESVERLKAFGPDMVLAPRLGDRHQDHRLVAELTWQTFRDQLIVEYEIPKFEGDLGQPNVFVALPERICRRKVELIENVFRTQASRSWFGADTFWALLRLRGLESNSPTRYAEAFEGRKLVL